MGKGYRIMSAMSRLATELELVQSGELDMTEQFNAILVSMGYEPADDVTELDVFDPERAAALAIVECGECGYHDAAMDMCQQSDGEYLCPSCDYSAYVDYCERANPRWSR